MVNVPNKLRLVLWAHCNRACQGCCNESYDLTKIDMWEGDGEWDEISVTGGEPLLFPKNTEKVLEWIGLLHPRSKVWLYTSPNTERQVTDLLKMQWLVDGITWTVHDRDDLELFAKYCLSFSLTRSMRVNVFKAVGEINESKLSPRWKVKQGIEWIKDYPLPEGEILRVANPAMWSQP